MANPSSSIWDHLEKNIAVWSTNDPGIMAAVIVGSRARQNPPADEWSDLDVILFMRDPTSHLSRTDWIREIGEPLLSITGRTVNNDPQRLIIFSDGSHVKFVFLPITAVDWLSQHGTEIEPFRRGAKVLVDKDGRLKKFFPADAPLSKIPVNKPPSSEDFERGVLSFWYTAFTQAKLLRRGDLWSAHAVDHQLKETLASVLALHATVVAKRDDAWPRGRFMQQWADSDALRVLPQTFWAYNSEDAWHALLVTIDLFQRVSDEIAVSLGYNYSVETACKLSAMIHALQPSENDHGDQETQ